MHATLYANGKPQRGFGELNIKYTKNTWKFVRQVYYRNDVCMRNEYSLGLMSKNSEECYYLKQEIK